MTQSQPHLFRSRYRPDIDGLRALAVLSVVAFHAFPDRVRGGFTGVDVFFVISGFLISTILFEGLDRGTFSFSEFYARRIRRIFPSLILILFAGCTLGWFSLLADEYKQLGKHIAAGAGFVSNFALWREAGYFDNAAETKPLLHLWSLGIEEQFYIVWPFLLWLAWKTRFNRLTLTALVTLVSFYLNIRGVHKDRVAAFYSPQTRFWELMCGSLLAWANLYKKTTCADLRVRLDAWLAKAVYRAPNEAGGETLANVLSLSGLMILVYGFLRIHKNLSFPGVWAVIPVLGTVLILSAGSQARINQILLSNKMAVWFGLISFPLYLWHWLLLSFARIVGGGAPGRNLRIAIVILSVLLAWLTYILLERPIRFGKRGARAKTAVLVLLMIAAGYAGYNVCRRDGIRFREVLKLNSTLDTADDGGDGGNSIHGCGIEDEDDRKLFAFCEMDKRGHVRFALLGDSKAGVLYPGLVRTSTDAGRWLFIGGYNGRGAPVPLISSAADPRPFPNQRLAALAVKAIAENPQIEKVVLVTSIRNMFHLSDGVQGTNAATYDYKYLRNLRSTADYDHVLAGLSETVSRLAKAGKKVVLVVDNPALPNTKDCIARKTSLDFINRFSGKLNKDCSVKLEVFKEQTAIYRRLLDELRSRYPLIVEIFDPTGIYCEEKSGICGSVRNARVLYGYTDHISDYTAGLVGSELNKFLYEN